MFCNHISSYKIDRSKYLMVLYLILISCLSCKKFIEVDTPITSINEGNIYESDETAPSVLTGIYTKISNAGTAVAANLISQGLLTGLASDELSLYDISADDNYTQFFQNSLSANTLGSSFDYWSTIYPIIFNANAAIDGLNASKKLSASVKNQLLGEAKFLRAYCYFYLTNFYGDVPLALSTDYNINYALSRSDQQKVWDQIILDLNDSMKLLNDGYVDNTALNQTSERIRPNKFVAKALLSRVYLYTRQYALSEAQATDVINNTSLYQLTDLDNVFLRNSNEAIWQLPSVYAGVNTYDGRTFIIPETGFDGDHPVSLSRNLYAVFEKADKRKSSWVASVVLDTTTYYYPYKYKVGVVGEPVTEYQMIFRLGEQYLIRAEARANEGNLPGAMEDLNAIRSRAGLSALNIADKNKVVDTILHERRVELFTEGAHRWFDLKRTNTINNVMTSVTKEKGGIWSANWQYYPIIVSELQLSPNVSQTTGY